MLMHTHYLHVAMFDQRVEVCVIDYTGVHFDLRVVPRVSVLTRVRFVGGDIPLRPTCCRFILVFYFSSFILATILIGKREGHMNAKPAWAK